MTHHCRRIVAHASACRVETRLDARTALTPYVVGTNKKATGEGV